MFKLKNRKCDKYGQIILDEKGIFDLLYKGEFIMENIPVEVSPDIKAHNKWMKYFDKQDSVLEEYNPLDISIKQFDEAMQNSWLFPKKYQELDVRKYILDKCNTQIEIDRVAMEYQLFEEREMIMVLRLLIYLTELMRKEKIVWGVGRGSACASYCLYLIGIHKVDSIKFELDIREFLKN